jgi:hypothetical protein
MRRISVLLIALAACGGGGGGGDDAVTPDADTSILDSFVGTWQATYAGTVTVTNPPMPTVDNGGNGTITVTAGGAADLVFSVELGADAHGTCTATLALDGATATFVPTQQSCSFTLDNGNSQTNTNTGTATVSGDTLTFDVDGTFTGTAPGPTPYEGTFQGTWTGTRAP